MTAFFLSTEASCIAENFRYIMYTAVANPGGGPGAWAPPPRNA